MKTLKWITSLLVMGIISFSSCLSDLYEDINFENCISGTGDIETRTLQLEAFSRFILDINADLYLTQGEAQSVQIQGKGNIIDAINTDISGNTWNITSEKCLKNTGDMKIFITIPTVSFISLSASGLIAGENTIHSNELEVDLSGSGRIDLNTTVDQIDGDLSGSGEVNISGDTEYLRFNISGAGDLQTFDLDSKRSFVSISGSGETKVNVQDNLKVRISGSGNVYYKGYPQLDVQVSGSGQVLDAN